MYQAYFNLTNLVASSNAKVAATAVISEQIEIIRNLKYADVGLVGGIPPGVIIQHQTLARNGKNFTVDTTVRVVDDPFDGTIGGSPNDFAPADYKIVQLTISCTSCKYFHTFNTTTTVAPPDLETSSGNGALFIQVFDGNGHDIPQASVHVANALLVPAISFDDVTDSTGWLRLVDVPPALESYQVTVTKPGYSSDKTYPAGDPANPNPTKLHATVVAGTVTQQSFAIDLLSELDIAALDKNCHAVPAVALQLTGSKLIGTSPSIYKFNQAFTTDNAGLLTLPAIEWDTYALGLNDPSLYLAGSLPSQPFAVGPGTQQSLSVITTPKTPTGLLIEVRDATNQLPIAHAIVNVTDGGYNNTLDTGEGYWQQSDWSGGSGQETIGDPTQYFSQDGNIDTANPPGDLTLLKNGLNYANAGSLTSSSFDNSTSTNFYHLTVRPSNQPPTVGPNPIKVQIASNDDNQTWSFVGPDGTSNTYYTPADHTLNAIHSNNRYIRYKVDLSTADPQVAPNVSDIALSFADACTPSGQVYFNDVPPSSLYTVTITATGYQTYTGPLTVNPGWQEQIITLSPL